MRIALPDPLFTTAQTPTDVPTALIWAGCLLFLAMLGLIASHYRKVMNGQLIPRRTYDDLVARADKLETRQDGERAIREEQGRTLDRVLDAVTGIAHVVASIPVVTGDQHNGAGG